jgi:hypothetical protein
MTGRTLNFSTKHLDNNTPKLTSHKDKIGRSMALLPTAKERVQCNRLAIKAYWSSLSKARSDVQQRFKVLTQFARTIAQR